MLRNDFLQADGQPPPLSLFGQKPKKKRKRKSKGSRGSTAWGKYSRACDFHEDSDDSDDDWVPENQKEYTKGRPNIGRREQEWEEVLLGDSSGQSEVSSEEIWLPESTVDSDEDQPGVSWPLLFVQ